MNGVAALVPLALSLAALLAGTSCVRLRVPYPEKRLYTLAAERGGASREQRAGEVLKVRRTRATAENEARAFLRRVEGDRYERDYYSEFLISPADLIGQATRKWLAEARLFEHVVDGKSPAVETCILESSLTALYVDETGSERPRAVLAVEYFLLATGGEVPVPILQSTYRAESPLAEGGAAEAVAGWNCALAEILARLEADLAERLGGAPAREKGISAPRAAP